MAKNPANVLFLVAKEAFAQFVSECERDMYRGRRMKHSSWSVVVVPRGCVDYNNNAMHCRMHSAARVDTSYA